MNFFLKTITTILLIGIVSFVLFRTSKNDAESTLKQNNKESVRFEDREHGFAFIYPSHCSVNILSEQSGLNVICPKTGESEPLFYVIFSPSNKTPEEALNEWKQSYIDQEKDGMVTGGVSGGEVVTVGTVNAVIFDNTQAGGGAEKGFLAQHNGYLFQVGRNVAQYILDDQDRMLAKEIFTSFTFTK